MEQEESFSLTPGNAAAASIGLSGAKPPQEVVEIQADQISLGTAQELPGEWGLDLAQLGPRPSSHSLFICPQEWPFLVPEYL